MSLPTWSWLTQDLLALLPTYGYSAIAAVSLVGAFGIPLPVTLLLLASGALAADGSMSFPLALLAALLAAVAGDCAGYLLARQAGRPLLDRKGRHVGLSPERLAAGERAFGRWGGGAVWLTRWLITPAGPAINVLAGTNRYPFFLFLALDVTGEAIWSGGYLGLGWFFGENWSELVDFVSSLSGAVLPVSAAVLLGILAWRLLRASAPAVPEGQAQGTAAAGEDARATTPPAVDA